MGLISRVSSRTYRNKTNMKTEIIIMSMAALSSTVLTINVHPFTASPEDCQKLCLLVEGCKRFGFTANKRCWLQSDDQCNFKIVPGKYSGFKTGPIATNVLCAYRISCRAIASRKRQM